MSRYVSVLLLFVSPVLLAQSWLPASAFPGQARDDAAGCTVGDKAYVATGLQVGWQPSAELFCFDFSSQTWSQKLSLPAGEERQYAHAFSDGTFFYILGGINGRGNLNDLWRYSPQHDTWRLMRSLPGVGRRGMSGFVLSDTAYVMGGATDNGLSDEMWAYCISQDSWHLKGSYPFMALWRSSATALEGKGYLLFGKDSLNAYPRSLYEYNPIKGQWLEISSFPATGRYYTALQGLGSRLLVLFGLDSTQKSLDEVWQFNVADQNWSKLESLADGARRGGVSFCDSEHVYYATGIDADNNRLQDCWRMLVPQPVSELSAGTDPIVYPNPSLSEVYVRMGGIAGSKYNYALYSSLGLMVMEGHWQKQDQVAWAINLSSLPADVYRLQILGPDQTWTFSVLKL